MTKVNLDATDRKILRFLVKNARMPYLEIARECGISGAAIHQRIKKLEDSGVVLGSRLTVNPKMLGFDVCAFVNIRIQDPMMTVSVVEKIKHIPELSIYIKHNISTIEIESYIFKCVSCSHIKSKFITDWRSFISL